MIIYHVNICCYLSIYSLVLHLWMQLSSTAANASSNGNGPSESADDDLPSVMTCANYLKLPPYSTKVLSHSIKFLIKL